MWGDFAQYIVKNYRYANRIVEVGVGSFPKIALSLRRDLKADVIMTDVKPSHRGVIQDDITKPDLKIYKHSSLIYSVRPPQELQPYLMELALKVGADLIIKPFSTESIDTTKKMKLINYKKATFYKMCYDEMAIFKCR